MPETFVLDCSVAAKWILPEPGSESALALLERYESGEVSLIAPDLLLAEFASLRSLHGSAGSRSPLRRLDRRSIC